jgi:hypothetical protein
MFNFITISGKQGIAFRGHREHLLGDSVNNGNFIELLKFLKGFVPDLEQFFTKNHFNYLHHDIQLELLTILCDELVKKLLPRPNAPFALIVDGTTDISHKDQITICIRYTDEDLDPQE